jgi:hypothetical protein
MMDHKAFPFDWVTFEREFLPTLERSLARNDGLEIRDFITAQWRQLRDPYEGDPLAGNWRDALDCGDIQLIADYAITKYYNPSDEFGLGLHWMRIQSDLPEEGRVALLGTPLGPQHRRFDPGRMGSYFQSCSQLHKSVTALDELEVPTLRQYRESLRSCMRRELGTYVTF